MFCGLSRKYCELRVLRGKKHPEPPEKQDAPLKKIPENYTYDKEKRLKNKHASFPHKANYPRG